MSAKRGASQIRRFSDSRKPIGGSGVVTNRWHDTKKCGHSNAKNAAESGLRWKIHILQFVSVADMTSQTGLANFETVQRPHDGESFSRRFFLFLIPFSIHNS